MLTQLFSTNQHDAERLLAQNVATNSHSVKYETSRFGHGPLVFLLYNIWAYFCVPVQSKVLESVVHTQMNPYLDQLGLLYKDWYGFGRGCNMVHAVDQLNNFVLDAMDRGKVTGLLFHNISKAFDKDKPEDTPG